MDTDSSPSRALAEAGRQHLAAIGLTRKGHSRHWIDDHHVWLINVEFQPSGFRKGSYLNVGVQWLWRRLETPAFAFDKLAAGKPWIRFDAADSFAQHADQLARTAAKYVCDFRQRFPSVRAIADDFLEISRPTPADRYFGAVALGVAGRTSEAAAWFDKFLAYRDDRDWARRWHDEAERLAVLVNKPAAFRAAVETIVAENRVLLRLPTVATPLAFEGV